MSPEGPPRSPVLVGGWPRRNRCCAVRSSGSHAPATCWGTENPRRRWARKPTATRRGQTKVVDPSANPYLASARRFSARPRRRSATPCCRLRSPSTPCPPDAERVQAGVSGSPISRLRQHWTPPLVRGIRRPAVDAVVAARLYEHEKYSKRTPEEPPTPSGWPGAPADGKAGARRAHRRAGTGRQPRPRILVDARSRRRFENAHRRPTPNRLAEPDLARHPTLARGAARTAPPLGPAATVILDTAWVSAGSDTPRPGWPEHSDRGGSHDHWSTPGLRDWLASVTSPRSPVAVPARLSASSRSPSRPPPRPVTTPMSSANC